MKQEKIKIKTRLVAVRLPEILSEEAKRFCEREDLTFSQLMRRGIKRELAKGGL